PRAGRSSGRAQDPLEDGVEEAADGSGVGGPGDDHRRQGGGGQDHEGVFGRGLAGGAPDQGAFGDGHGRSPLISRRQRDRAASTTGATVRSRKAGSTRNTRGKRSRTGTGRAGARARRRAGAGGAG